MEQGERARVRQGLCLHAGAQARPLPPPPCIRAALPTPVSLLHLVPRVSDTQMCHMCGAQHLAACSPPSFPAPSTGSGRVNPSSCLPLPDGFLSLVLSELQLQFILLFSRYLAAHRFNT